MKCHMSINKTNVQTFSFILVNAAHFQVFSCLCLHPCDMGMTPFSCLITDTSLPSGSSTCSLHILWFLTHASPGCSTFSDRVQAKLIIQSITEDLFDSLCVCNLCWPIFPMCFRTSSHLPCHQPQPPTCHSCHLLHPATTIICINL